MLVRPNYQGKIINYQNKQLAFKGKESCEEDSVITGLKVAKGFLVGVGASGTAALISALFSKSQLPMLISEGSCLLSTLGAVGSVAIGEIVAAIRRNKE